MKGLLLRLKELVGHVITRIRVELYLYDGDKVPVINDVEVEFDNNKSFVLGCSGDGHILVKEGQAKVYAELNEVSRSDLIDLNIFIGSKLDSIEETEDSISLIVDGERLTFKNEDDEMILFLNGDRVDASF